MDSNNELFNKNRIKLQLLSFFADKAKAEWSETVNRVKAWYGSGRNKLRTYKLFKTDYKRENYVQIILPRNHRSVYAKFRSGVAPLRLETGRYEHIEERDRLCFNCGSQIETEEHVLTQCPLYSDLREALYGNISEFVPNFLEFQSSDKMKCILSSDIIPVIRASAKICHDILTVRRQLLYK